MKILSIGSFNGLSNTCVHRNWSLQKLGAVDMVNMYSKPTSLWFRIANRLFNYGLPIHLPDSSDCNKQIVKLVKENRYDVVWIDKGWLINKSTLQLIKKHSPLAKIISYSPDNMVLRHNQSQNFLDCVPLYDIHFTTKSYIIDAMKQLGVKKAIFTNNSFESRFHYPRQLNTSDLNRLGGDVGFIGAWEKERADSILHLAKNGISVRVFGGGKWLQYKGTLPNLTIENHGLFSEDYSKGLQAFKISLCFLRKMNFDLQTSRTMEIPACGGFMLAERTDEHLALFEEGKEADYFSSDEELLEKCKYYLDNEAERIDIANAGHERCNRSGYSNTETIKRLLDSVIT